jgi:hypothetical protein
MKGTVNPFEPWRPRVDRVPPPLHSGRPWRPPSVPPVLAAVEEPPLVEPVKPHPRNKPPERPKRPQGRTRQPPARCTCIAQLVIPVLFGTLGTLGLLGVMLSRSGPHTPRVLAWALSGSMFLFMALPLPHRSWYTRMKGMLIALALAGIALWFVPTIHGVSLWSAYRQIEKLRALPPGDVAGYQRGAPARQTLVADFPSFAAEVRAAEQSWFRRTVDEAIENADRRLAKDPDAVLARLHRLDKVLSLVEPKHYDLVRKDLESARRRAVQACVKVAQQP